MLIFGENPSSRKAHCGSMIYSMRDAVTYKLITDNR
jgi:hypothetical protein